MDSPGADRWGVIEAVWNRPFEKHHLQAKQVSAQIIASQNVQKSSPDHILAWFLHHSHLRNVAQTARTSRIARTLQNVIKINPNILNKNPRFDCRLRKSTLCWTYYTCTWSIWDLWVTNLIIDLGAMRDELDHSWPREWRHWTILDLQRMKFLRPRSNFRFLFQNGRVDLNVILRFSGNSDGSGGLGEAFEVGMV